MLVNKPLMTSNDSFCLRCFRFPTAKSPIITSPAKQGLCDVPPSPSDTKVRRELRRVLVIMNSKVVYNAYLRGIYRIIGLMGDDTYPMVIPILPPSALRVIFRIF